MGRAVVIALVTAGALALPAAASAGYGSLSTASVNAAGTSTAETSTGGSRNATGSAGGRTVAFQSQASDLALGATDDNHDYDVFVRDIAAGTTALVSHAAGAPATAADAASTAPVVSGDGQYVAYMSEADNLVGVGGSGDGSAHVYLYNRTTGTNVLVDHAFANVDAAGAAGALQVSAISHDGRYVVYISPSADLVGDPANDGNGAADVFVYDRTTGANRLVSHTGADQGVAASGGDAFNAYASSDAGLVTFSSAAVDIAGGTQTNVYLWHMASGAITLVSHADGGSGEQDGASLGMDLSTDGRYLLYESDASNAVPGQTPAAPGGTGPADIFLYDVDHNTSTLVSHAADHAGQETDSASIDGNLSADGQFAAWSSVADGVIPASPAGLEMVYAFDRTTGNNTLVSHSSADSGTPAGSDSRAPHVSPDGSTVAYESDADDLVPGEVPEGPSNVFAWDRASGGNLLVSHTAASAATGGSATSERPRFAGPLLLFESDAENLASPTPDGNHARDVFAAGTPAASDGSGTTTGGGGGGGTTTTTTTTGGGGGGGPTIAGGGNPQPSPTLQALLTTLLATTAGPCDARIGTDFALVACGGNKKAGPDLRVYVVNARATPVTVTLGASEALPRNAAAAKKVSYAKRTLVVPAYGSATVTLKAPAKLRKALLKALKRVKKVSRRPTVTLTGAGVARTSLTHAVTMRRK